MRRFVLPLVVVLAACSGSGTAASSTSLVTLDQLADIEQDISGATGVDLEELEPNPAGICDAFGAAPSRWLQDAVVPLQVWVSNFEQVGAPPEVAEPVDVLLDFGRRRLEWNFKSGERPMWEADTELAERALTEWALASCDLPPVVGLWSPGIPAAWADLAPGEIEERCDIERGRVSEAQEEYRMMTGAYARHVIALETHLEVFYASDHFYVTAADTDSFDLAPVPEGACDFP